MKKSVYLLCLISSVLIMSCASNKTDFSTIANNNELNSIELINKNCNPYNDKYLEFIIITNEIQQSKYEDKNIFKVILDHGNIDIQLTEKYKNLGSTEEEADFIRKSISEITMLLKYLSGFYFGKALPQELTLYKNSDKDLIYCNEYYYNSVDCINYYITNNNLLSGFQTYIKKDSQKTQVDTKYNYKTYNNKNYLLNFESKNFFHSFDFSLEIDYIEKMDFLVPNQFTVTTKQFVNNNGKINLLTTKFEILADNQLIQ
ncbi:hypothetical protein [Treponema bryantii]|nr:hypothetical protein [Treponema bryantii]